MYLSFRDLPGDVIADGGIWDAEVAICQTLAQADILSAACKSHFGDLYKGRVLTFAAGYWFVVLLSEEMEGDTDVKNNNS